MKKIFLATLATAVALSLVGCKSSNEKRGDDHLGKGNFRNAVNSYIEAKKKGNISEEFYDNFTLALVRAGEMESKKDVNSELLDNYFDKAAKNLPEVKKNEVIEAYVMTLADIGKRQALQDGVDYGTIVGAFAKLDSAESTAKARGVALAAVKSVRTETENQYVAKNIGDAKDESDPVVSEYMLMQIAEMARDNQQIKEALNKSRKMTRGYFLIFGDNIPDKTAKHRIDKWGYIMSMPTIKLTGTMLAGELQFWATTGNNTDLDPALIKLVSTDGKEVFAKGNTGWCEKEVLVGKKGEEKIEKKQIKFKGKGKLMNEFLCSVNVVFNFPKGFVPDYIQYKDTFGEGIKYLGH